MPQEIRALRVFGVFEPRAAAETDVQFGKQPGEAHRPQAEVGDPAPRRARLAGMQVCEHGREQPEVLFVGLVGRQEVLGDFGEIIERAGGGEIARGREVRNADLAGIDVHELAILALEIGQLHVRKPLEADPKPPLGRRARRATPRSLPRSRVRKLTMRSPSLNG